MNDLAEVLTNIANEYDGEIRRRGKHYVQPDLESAFAIYGKEGEEFFESQVFVPIRFWEGVFKIAHHSGSEFEGYRQLDSGIIVPPHIAEAAQLAHKAYRTPKAMFLCGNQREFSRWYIHNHGMPEEPSPET